MKQLVHRVKTYMKIIRRYLIISFQLVAEYRKSFILTSISISLWLVADFFWLYLLFQYTDSFAGYGVWHYIGFLGCYFLIINLFWFVFDKPLDSLSRNIYEGKIDQWITKPIDSQYAVSFREFDINSLPNFIFGFATIIVAIIKTNTTVNFTNLILVILTGIIAIVIMYACMFTAYSLTFWIGRSGALKSFMHILFDDPATIPATAYKGFVKFLFYFVIPAAMIATVPTEILFFYTHWNYLLYSTIFAVGMLLLSRIVWHLGLRTYTSVSS